MCDRKARRPCLLEAYASSTGYKRKPTSTLKVEVGLQLVFLARQSTRSSNQVGESRLSNRLSSLHNLKRDNQVVEVSITQTWQVFEANCVATQLLHVVVTTISSFEREVGLNCLEVGIVYADERTK